jgi:hypothetical protein
MRTPFASIDDVAGNDVYLKRAHAVPAPRGEVQAKSCHECRASAPSLASPLCVSSRHMLHLRIELGARASTGTEPASHTIWARPELEGVASGVRWERASGRGARNTARDAIWTGRV